MKEYMHAALRMLSMCAHSVFWLKKPKVSLLLSRLKVHGAWHAKHDHSRWAGDAACAFSICTHAAAYLPQLVPQICAVLTCLDKGSFSMHACVLRQYLHVTYI